MNRREFLKIAGIAGAAFASGTIPFIAKKISPSSKLRFSTKTDAVCSYCSLGCSLELYNKNGQYIAVKAMEGDLRGGTACVRALALPGILNAAKPSFLLRKSNSDAWETISEDDAVRISAAHLMRIRNESFSATADGYIVNRLESIAPVAGSSLTNEEAYNFTRLFHILGVPYVGSEQLINNDEASGLMKSVFGNAASHLGIESIVHSSVILLVGSDLANNNSPFVARLIEAKKRGAFIIAVNTGLGVSSRLCDLNISIRPGTDAALFSGIVNYLLTQNLFDRQFCAENTDLANVLPADFSFSASQFSGFDQASRSYKSGFSYSFDERGLPEKDKAFRHERVLLKHLTRFFSRWSPGSVSEVTGIDPEKFLMLAEKIGAITAGKGNLATIFGGSVVDRTRGGAALHAASIIHLLTASVGRPGAGIIWIKSGGNTQGVEDFIPSWNELPGGLPLPDVSASKPESDYKTYERNRLSLLPTSFLSLFPGIFSGIMQSFFRLSGTDYSHEGFEYLPKSDSSFGSHRFFEQLAEGRYKAYVFMGSDLVSMNLSQAEIAKILSADFIFISSDSPLPQKVFDAVGRSSAEIIFFRSADRIRKKGSFTDTFRVVKWNEGSGDVLGELSFMSKLSRAISEINRSSEGTFPDPISSMNEFSSDPESIFREISGLNGDSLIEQIAELSGNKKIRCGNWRYLSAASGSLPVSRSSGRHGFRWGFAWPMNSRIQFNSLAYRKDERMKAADSSVSDDVPYGLAGGDGAFSFNADCIAHVFVSKARKGPLPFFYEPSVYGLSTDADPFYPKFPQAKLYGVTLSQSISSMAEFSLAKDLFLLPVCEVDPETAAAYSLKDGDHVSVNGAGKSIEAVLRVMPGRAFRRHFPEVQLVFLRGMPASIFAHASGSIFPISLVKV